MAEERKFLKCTVDDPGMATIDDPEIDEWYEHTKNIKDVKHFALGIASIDSAIEYWKNVMYEEFRKLSDGMYSKCSDYDMLMIDKFDYDVRTKFEDAIKYKIHVLEERKKQYEEKLNELVK